MSAGNLYPFVIAIDEIPHTDFKYKYYSSTEKPFELYLKDFVFSS